MQITDKIDALNYVLTVIDQHLEKLAGPLLPWEPSSDAPTVEQLHELRAEVLAHREPLEYAHLACTMGQQNIAPDSWEAAHPGQPFDFHVAVVEALDLLPAAGHLSPELLAYIDELPGRLLRAHEELIARAQADTTMWPDNPMKQLTSKQVGDMSAKLVEQSAGGTKFTLTYAADVAQALHLARQRGNWQEILAYLE